MADTTTPEELSRFAGDLRAVASQMDGALSAAVRSRLSGLTTSAPEVAATIVAFADVRDACESLLAAVANWQHVLRGVRTGGNTASAGGPA